jgi:uncharacterized membrane protein
MKTTQLTLTTVILTLAMFSEAFAASTTRVYSSGIFVLAFIGLCALVVVIQLIPAIMTMCGMIKGAMENSKKTAKASSEN